MAEDDFGFNFDPKDFISAMNKMTDSYDKMTGGVASGQKEANDSFGKFFGGLLKKLALIGVAFIGMKKIIGSAFAGLPEIGQTFSIMKDIITRNLFFPLRQLVVPMLQKMLDWVRDNRTMFLKMGQVIANAFKISVSWIKSVIKLLKIMFKSFKKVITGIFGEIPGTFEKIINVLTFKLSALLAFLAISLEPVASVIATIVGLFTKFSVGLGSSFLKGFKDIGISSVDVGKLAESFLKLKKVLSDIFVKFDIGEKLKKFAEALGSVFAENLNSRIKLLTSLFEILAKIANLEMPSFESLKTIGGSLANLSPAVVAFKIGKKFLTKTPEEELQRLNKVRAENERQPLTLDLARTLQNQGKDLKTVVLNANLNVTEGSAVKAGENFVGGMVEKLKTTRDILQDDITGNGGD